MLYWHNYLISLILLRAVPVTEGGCTFLANFQLIVTHNGAEYKDIDLDNDNLNVAFEVGDFIVVKCITSQFQFVNDIRKIDGVDTFSMDQGNGITIKCGVGDQMIPDITRDILGNERYLYCTVGCAPVREDKYKVVYNDAIVTEEPSSPPIRPLNYAYISLACQSGYTEATGSKGKTETYCREFSAVFNADWNPAATSFINCVRGCPDITSSVTDGVTTDVPNTTPGKAPFKPGDTVTFSCDEGYVLVGYKTLTCTGLLRWSENTPECVQI